MKKSLLALAAMTAFAGAAQAQSSVTVYGILDVGYAGGKATDTSATGVKTVTNVSQFGQSQESSSRLGFKGTEDLGGGSSAFFTVELGLNPESANISGGSVPFDKWQQTSNNPGSAVDNRQSFAGLKKNGIGQFAFGRQYTVIFQEAAKTDPTQLANVQGNVIYQGSTTIKPAAGSMQYGESFTNRADNALTAGTDTFAGFQGNAFYALANTNLTDTGAANTGNQNWNGYGLNANYTWHNLYATVAYQSFKTQVNNGINASAANLSINGAGPTGGQLTAAGALIPAVQISDKQTYVAGTYDFGILKAYAQWIGRKIQNDYTSTVATAAGAQLNRTAQAIGVRSYITPTIEAYGQLGNGKWTGPVAATGTPASASFVGWQVGSNYYLSKRTNLYAIYGSTNTSQSTVIAGSGASANQYAVGLRHTF
ncbi:porin [Polynucleobacter sp. AP-Kaivos-20-H2]|uniref:porin n=1 Tax=Polynucleobacter sp. AP-Kaivos-20-H2 TaxID=2689104 RepID=UPI001C0B8FC8|nr:porin [Polynucleobacter sp. AP-Kaivos-20-H2]MBU3604341.1 porin [Polynucleobacter sp. AP-Kaivos-20-H2]